MKRLTDKKVAENLKSNIEGLKRAGVDIPIDDIRYIKLAEYENEEECEKCVDRWISVDDGLPEENSDCLVWYRCDTAYGKSESWGIAHCSRGDWYTKHLHGDNIVVLYWHPLPEPPKK